MKEEKRKMRRNVGGFTLVELIVVLVILSILSAVAVPSVLGFIDDSKAKECQTQVEALTAEISSAKLAYEANGEVSESGEVGREFDKAQIDAYIAAAGDEGCCPVDNVPYEYKQDENKIVCPKGHGEGIISNSGKFTVAVVEETEKRESPDESKPETPAEDKNEKEEKEEHTYHATIDPNSLSMKTGDAEKSVHVTVMDGESPVPEDHIVAVEWVYPEDGCLTGSGSGTTASVKPNHKGGGKLSCKVTVRNDDGSTTTFTADPVDVNVDAPELKLSGPEELPVKKGESASLGVTATDENGNPYNGTVDYKFESSNSSGLSVDPDGTIHANEPGTYTVTVTATDKNDSTKTDTKTVTVTVEAETEAEKASGDATISLNASSLLINSRTVDKMILEALLEGDTTGKWIEWSVAPEGVIEIKDYRSGNEYGYNNVCGMKPIAPSGTCVITAKIKGGNSESVATCTITTYQMLDSVGVPEGEGYKSLYVGDEYQINPVFSPSYATYKSVTYKSSDESIATVDASGKVTAVGVGDNGVGKAQITITREQPLPDDSTDPTRTFVVSLDVFPLYPTEAHVEPSKVDLYLDGSGPDSMQVQTIVDEPKSEHVSLNVRWESKNSNVATVDNDGLITAKGEGNCSIYAYIKTGKYGEKNIEQIVDVNVKKKGAEKEVILDGKRLRANSWKEFFTKVKNATQGSYKNNQPGDSPIYYDVDENGNRTLYVAIGRGNTYKNYDDDRNGKDVLGSDSFASFIEKNGNENFVKIATPIKLAATVKKSELIGNETGFNVGDIVKVIDDDTGETEYYISITNSSKDRIMNQIGTGKYWWKLEFLPGV